jgi:hypothetical protein
VDFHFRVEHQEARPPRTFALQVSIGAQPQAVERRVVVARSLTQLAAQPNPTVQLRAVAATERDVIVKHSREVMKAREERKTVEEKEARSAGGEPVRVTAPVRAKLPATPVAAKSVEVKEQAPPKKPEVSKTDASVQPKPQPVPVKKAPAPTAPPPTAKTAPPPVPSATKKPAEPPPPTAKKPTEPPPQAKKESPEKSKDKDRDDADDESKDKSKEKSKDKPKKKKKDDDR